MLSLIVRIYLSMSGTCSFSAQVFKEGNQGRIGSNSPSARMLVMEKPRWWYVLMTDRSFETTVLSFLSGSASTVPKCKLRDVVTRNGTLLTNIMSMAIVTCLCNLRISGGTGCIFVFTCFSPLRTVFPFNEPRFFPRMSFAALTSVDVTGHCPLK